MPTELSRNFRLAEEVLTTRVGEETILLNLKTGMYHGLDPVATRFLELLQTDGNLSAVHTTMLNEFEVSAETLRADLVRLSDEMLSKGLLVTVNR